MSDERPTKSLSKEKFHERYIKFCANVLRTLRADNFEQTFITVTGRTFAHDFMREPCQNVPCWMVWYDFDCILIYHLQ